MKNNTITTLNEILTGQNCQVIRLHAAGTMRQRLMTLGLHPEKTIRMIKAAPLKDPLEIALGGEHLSIRRKEAALIEVKKVESDDGSQ